MTQRPQSTFANPYETGGEESGADRPARATRAAMRLLAMGGVGMGAAGLQLVGAGAAHADEVVYAQEDGGPTTYQDLSGGVIRDGETYGHGEGVASEGVGATAYASPSVDGQPSEITYSSWNPETTVHAPPYEYRPEGIGTTGYAYRDEPPSAETAPYGYRPEGIGTTGYAYRDQG